MPSSDSFLKCLSDPFTPVRALDGRLLGCIPRVADDANMTGAFPLQIAGQVCVVCDPTDMMGRNVYDLPGFIPFDDTQTDLALPVGGDNSDIAEGV